MSNPETDDIIFREMYTNLQTIDEGAAALGITESIAIRMTTARDLYSVSGNTSRWRGILKVGSEAITNALTSGSTADAIVLIDEYLAADPSLHHDDL